MTALMRMATEVGSEAKMSQNELLMPSASLLMGDLPTMPKQRCCALAETKGSPISSVSVLIFHGR